MAKLGDFRRKSGKVLIHRYETSNNKVYVMILSLCTGMIDRSSPSCGTEGSKTHMPIVVLTGPHRGKTWFWSIETEVEEAPPLVAGEAKIFMPKPGKVSVGR